VYKLPISLSIFAKNNEDSLELTIKSVIDIVNEFVLVDTGSTDKTIQIAKDYGARVYKVGFTDFGSIRTLALHLAREEWVLSLDSDEIINRSEIIHFIPMLSRDDLDAWGLPRRRWADLKMKQQVEKDAYPDWQYRLVRNKPYMYYKYRVHESLDGARNTSINIFGPHIEHFQDVFKYGNKLKQRNQLYKELYELDLKDNIHHNIPAVADIDLKKE
jgi:glycosyltransferase involved in cell wall biosynthesis